MPNAMRIRYARKVNVGDYSNFDVEGEDDVQADETPAMALLRIQRFIDDAVQLKLASRSTYFAEQDKAWYDRYYNPQHSDPQPIGDDF